MKANAKLRNLRACGLVRTTREGAQVGGGRRECVRSSPSARLQRPSYELHGHYHPAESGRLHRTQEHTHTRVRARDSLWWRA